MPSSASSQDYGTISPSDDDAVPQAPQSTTEDAASETENNNHSDTTTSAKQTERSLLTLPTATSTYSAASSTITKSIKSKVPLPSFLWHQHSVLGLTVPDDDSLRVTIAAGPCPCCEIDPEGLTRRRRLFLFLMVFFVSTALAVQVSLGKHGSFYALNAMILVVLPLVCHLKENLPTYSMWLKSRGIGPFGTFADGRDGPRFEEVALASLFGLSVLKLWNDHKGMGIAVLDNVLWVWFGSMVAEVCCLVFKYYFGKYCCCCFSCCVPSTYKMMEDSDDEDDDGGV